MSILFLTTIFPLILASIDDPWWESVCVCMCVCVCAHVHVYVCACTCAHTFVCTRACVSVCMCVLHVHVCMHVLTHMCLCVRTRVCVLVCTCVCSVTRSCPALWDPWTVGCQASLSTAFSRQILACKILTGVHFHFLLQGTCSTQGSKPSLGTPALTDGFFTNASPGKPNDLCIICQMVTLYVSYWAKSSPSSTDFFIQLHVYIGMETNMLLVLFTERV